MHRYVLRLYFASVFLMLCVCVLLFFKFSFKPVKRGVEEVVQDVVFNAPEEGEGVKEVIVVLGERLHSDQMPRIGLKRRVLHAVSVWKQSVPRSLMILSGSKKHDAGFVEEDYTTEASAMLEIAVCKGVKRSHIWLEERATNTAENAAFVAEFVNDLISHNFSSVSQIRIITSEWHLPRAKTVFEVFFARYAWKLIFDGALDNGSEQRIREDLMLMPSTIHDMQAIRSGLDKSLVMWSIVVQQLRNMNHLKRAKSFLLAKTVRPPPLELKISAWKRKCSLGDISDSKRNIPFVWIELEQVAAEVKVCNSAKHMFVEAHLKDMEEQEKSENVEVRKVSPLTSTTWVFHLMCKQNVEERISEDLSELGRLYAC